ncbi:lipase/acyltransferase domain-containing protein [Streptomyces scabiei]|uniref:lipase/acyltransferase domain-containing protein n=1 Tax=Streptomyces scabiei TaxID=1930 RepID=UPI002FF2402E
MTRATRPHPTTAPLCHDAVIVVPGIMGSELVNTATGSVLWGLADLSWYVSAWCDGRSLDELAVRDPDPAMEARRVKPLGLLRFPAFMPFLAGLEPYTPLLERLAAAVAHPAALTEFAYDWRLPATYNAELLAQATSTQLTHWRRYAASRRPHGAARAVIIAHSMGGLLVREMARIPGALDDVRSVITLGTPFQGTLDAVEMLVPGRPGPFPLPKGRLRRLARTLPAVQDLLPTYPCVHEAGRLRPLTAGDLDANVPAWTAQPLPRLPGHVCVVGMGQPTYQSLTIHDGDLRLHRHLPETDFQDPGAQTLYVDHSGDGTVYRYSAQQSGAERHWPHQTHGALARSNDIINHIVNLITEKPGGPALGGARIGLEAPDMVRPGEPFRVRLTGPDAIAAICSFEDLTSGSPDITARLRGDSAGGRTGMVRLTRPGLYRVRAAGGGGSPVLRMLLVAAR